MCVEVTSRGTLGWCCNGIRRRNFPTASQHKTTLYRQSVRPTCLMYHRYPYSSFAEYSAECIRGNHRGHLTNACVVWISRGNKEKDLFGFEQKIHSVPNCKVWKISVIAKQTHSRYVIVNSWLLIVDCWLLNINSLINLFCWTSNGHLGHLNIHLSTASRDACPVDREQFVFILVCG